MHKPTDSVRIALFDQDDPSRFLVITEADDAGNWKLPGGKFEGEETPVEAANRELKEEIGVDGQQVRLVEAEKLVNDDGVSARYIFVGTVAPDAVSLSAEIAEADWFTEETLPDCKNRGHILAAVGAARKSLEHAAN